MFAEVKTDEIYAKQEAAVQRSLAMMKAGRIMEVLHERKFDLVEAFPTNFYSDGIRGLELSLRMRQIVAIKRWRGNESYSLSDVICSSFNI
ncbi:MAG TPA: hypothetical protein DHV85_13530 [Candidatus Accumulibacter sp.]|nr:hypothetical protein [Accumulibacter sp.]HCZ15584.1 hypothetical protein [Accumulibacter sp.]HRF11942.1 hypothetical protein [Candidatus Accumulibacter phosphatis]